MRRDKSGCSIRISIGMRAEARRGISMKKRTKKSEGQERTEVHKNRLSRSKLKTGVSVAALSAAVAVFVILVQMEKSVLDQYEKGRIYVAAGMIPKGQMITEENCMQYFTPAELDKRLIPAAALVNPEQVRGLAAVFDVEQGALLTKGMFEELESILNGMAEPVIAGFKAEDIYQVAGGTLRAGDRIHIYTVREGEAALAWEAVYVQQVFDASGGIIASTDKFTAAQRINIYLDKGDVGAFYTGLAEGSLRAVKVCD